jgi:hypothetical protein
MVKPRKPAKISRKPIKVKKHKRMPATRKPVNATKIPGAKEKIEIEGHISQLEIKRTPTKIILGRLPKKPKIIRKK